MGNLLTLLIINSLTVLLRCLGALLGVGRVTVLLRNLVASFLINCLTVLLGNLHALLSVAGAALLVVTTFVLVNRLREGSQYKEIYSFLTFQDRKCQISFYSDPSLTLPAGDVLALVVVHGVALLAVRRLQFSSN